VRYLFARGQKSVVHAISWISLGGLLVSTAALIIVLSVYNGIGELTKSLFNTFDPELIIEPAEGKTLHAGDIDLSNVDYAGHVWLTGFMNPDGPLIVTAIRFYS
jgi:ABC-type lipoprotein release transport system permease subunit